MPVIGVYFIELTPYSVTPEILPKSNLSKADTLGRSVEKINRAFQFANEPSP